MNDDGGVAALSKYTILAKEGLQKRNAELIDIVIKHPDIFVFGEFIDSPAIAALKGGEFGNAYSVLELFAYGSYADYKTSPASVRDKIGPDALTKLKKLGVVDCAGKKKVLAYADLMRDLDIQTTRELEDLLIDCIFSGLVAGNLDPRGQKFDVSFSFGRDVQTADLKDMMDKLTAWTALSEEMVGMLDKEAAGITKKQKMVQDKQSDLLVKSMQVADILKQKEAAKAQEQQARMMRGNMGLVGPTMGMHGR